MKNQNSLKNYLYGLCWSYKIYIIGLVLLAIFAGIFSISVNYKIKEIIDTISANPDANLLSLILLFVFYKFMHHGMFFISRLFDIRYKPLMLVQIVSDIYKKTLAHSLHWFDSHLSGEIAAKVTDFQNAIIQLVTFSFRALNNVSVIVISIFFLIKINIIPTIIIIVFVLTYTPILYLLLRKQMRLQEQYSSSRQQTTGIINDSIANILGIKIIGNVASELKLKLNPALANWANWDKITRKFDAYVVDNTDTLMVTILNIVQILSLTYLFRNGYITAGGFAFVAMVTLNIHAELDKFLDSLLTNINPLIATMKASFAFVNQGYDTEDKADAIILQRVKGEIEFSNVTFAYGDGSKKILEDFNLKIMAGQRIGIVGTSGAGKTTLVKCILRYFDIQNGKITIDGDNISDVKADSLWANISLIPQDITMFHRSIFENLQLAKANATMDEIKEACKKAKIHDDIMQMDKNYDSIVGERGVKVSGGQRQRIAIARAILKNAPILILDEATSALDTPTEKLIQSSINEVLETSNATVIAIAHRLSTLKHMDVIIVMDKGKIVEQGNHDELLERENGFYKKLWQEQMI